MVHAQAPACGVLPLLDAHADGLRTRRGLTHVPETLNPKLFTEVLMSKYRAIRRQLF